MEQVNSLTDWQLAEILWDARSLARDVSNPSPLSKTPAYTRNRYQRFAVELRRLLNRGLYRRRGPETVAEWTRAINALGSVGRKAVITTGELDDGIKAELDAAYERAEQAERDRDSARADSERLKAAARNLQELVEGLRQDGKRLAAERDQARAERDAARVGMEKLRGLHRGVCVGACGLDDACECEERDLACDECSASWPCDTIRALDGTEAAR